MEQMKSVALEVNELEPQENHKQTEFLAFSFNQISIDNNRRRYFIFENRLENKSCRLTHWWRNELGSFGKKVLL